MLITEMTSEECREPWVKDSRRTKLMARSASPCLRGILVAVKLLPFAEPLRACGSVWHRSDYVEATAINHKRSRCMCSSTNQKTFAIFSPRLWHPRTDASADVPWTTPGYPSHCGVSASCLPF